MLFSLKATHATSERVAADLSDVEAGACDLISDGAALAIASYYAAPSGPGAALASLATGAEREHRTITDSIEWHIEQAAGNAEQVRELRALRDWFHEVSSDAVAALLDGARRDDSAEIRAARADEKWLTYLESNAGELLDCVEGWHSADEIDVFTAGAIGATLAQLAEDHSASAVFRAAFSHALNIEGETVGTSSAAEITAWITDYRAAIAAHVIELMLIGSHWDRDAQGEIELPTALDNLRDYRDALSIGTDVLAALGVSVRDDDGTVIEVAEDAAADMLEHVSA